MSKGIEALEELKQNNKDNSHLFDDELLATIEKEVKALEIISKAYGDYANHKISEYELIMTIGENTNY